MDRFLFFIRVGCLFVIFICSLSYFVSNSWAVSEGIYISKDRAALKLDITQDGDYDFWLEKGDDVVEIQLGKYVFKNNKIVLRPEMSDIGDMNPIEGTVLDECTIKLKGRGVFTLQDCKSSSVADNTRKEIPKDNINAFHAQREFPKNWHVVKKQGVEIYVPVDATVRTTDSTVVIDLNGGEAGVLKFDNGLMSHLIRKCNPVDALSKADTTFYVCSKSSDSRFLQVVGGEKAGGKTGVFSYVKAADISTLKALSIAVSSLKPINGKTSTGSLPKFVTWRPTDRSFSIMVPEGWQVNGGTADFGRNGYIRIVQALSPDKEAGFLGVYYPFYEYAQTSMGTSGMPPVDARTYVSENFFSDLAAKYHITFDNLQIKHLEIDRALSQKFTRQYSNFMNSGGSANCKVVKGSGTFTFEGKPYDMMIFAVMSYSQNPMSGFGYLTIWGPGPMLIGTALKGDIHKWEPVFKKMAESWQVDMNWLSSHSRMARADAQRVLSHYSKMRRLIHENSEHRMQSGMEEWSSEESERMEEFWDTFHALGGEERYDDPVTGEEVDVPIGADKYLYDHLSKTWVGVRDDNPDADEIIQHLKEKGFRKLRLHTH